MSEPEPWLRGPMPDVPAHVMPVCFSFQQVREDLAGHMQAIGRDQLWRELAGKHSLGYHLKHMAGSVDRLSTYLRDEPLSEGQLVFLGNEHRADSDLAGLLELILESLAAAERQLLGIEPQSLFDVRRVGRGQLPTSVIGLLVHLCEHTQRHLGQAILLAKLLQQA